MRLPHFLVAICGLLSHVASIAIPEPQLSLTNDTTSLDRHDPSFEAELAKVLVRARNHRGDCQNVAFTAIWDKGRIWLQAVFKAGYSAFYFTADTDYDWRNPTAWVMHRELPSHWPDPRQTRSIVWRDVRLRFDEATDILARSGKTTNQDFVQLIVQWDFGPPQTYYEFRSREDPRNFWRVGVETLDVSRKPWKPPNGAVSELQAGGEVGGKDEAWYDKLAVMDGDTSSSDIDSNGVAVA